MSFPALLLDFGGVCLKTPFELHRQVEAHLGLAAGAITWMGPLDPSTDPLWRAMQADEIDERAYWRRRAAGLGLSLREYMNVCYDAPYEEIMRMEAHDVVARAKAAGRRVGVLTNDMERFHGSEWVAGIRLLDEVDALVDASRTGVLKPDPRAYELALQALEVRPSEVLFADDQPRNVQGARDLGIEAVFFHPARPAEGWAEVARRMEL